MTALSVIIPAYNAGRTLRGCLDSLIAQEDPDLEFIVIDDGSTDDTLQIAEAYREKDRRIRVITQSNQGTSAARNAGIEQAAGRCLAFADADDLVAAGTYSTALGRMRQDTEILSFGVSVDFVEEGYSKLQQLPESRPEDSKEKQIRDLFAQDDFNYIWNKIYRRELIGSGIRFPSSHNQGEDLVFNCRAYAKASRIQAISDVLYHYRKHSGATMVSRYTGDSCHVLQAKKDALLELLKAADNPVFCDYMLREYEVFTINLYLPGNDLSAHQRTEMIRNQICTADAQAVIRRGRPAYFNGRLFRKLALSGSPAFIAAAYSVLNWGAGTFRSFYRGIRRRSYQTKNAR